MTDLLRLSPEEQSLDNTLWELVRPDGYLPAEECQQGELYWVTTRSIGELAICNIKDDHTTWFTGLRHKLGVDYLFDELHWDQSDMIGTAQPILKLEERPPGDANEEQLMGWLLDRMIEFHDEKLEYLNRMPKHFHRAESYAWLVSWENDLLSSLNRTKHEGFMNEPYSFKKIMEARRKDKALEPQTAV